MKKILLILFIFFTIKILLFYNSLPKNLIDYQRINYYDINEILFFTEINDSSVKIVENENVSNYFINSLISIEDQKFYTHSGFDLARITKAFFSNINSGEIKEGASTITQQYVKNNFLTNEKTYSRKIKEIFLSILVEIKYSKEEILNSHLNTLYFGHGIYSIENASQYYFNKSAQNLTLSEANSLVVIQNAPSIYSPIIDKEANLKRTNDYLKRQNEAEVEEIKLDVVVPNRNLLYYLDELKKYLPELNKNSKKDIYTTLDYDLFNYINTEIITDKELQTAIYVVQPNTNRVLALFGGNNYDSQKFNLSTQSYRQPASTIKPLLYYYGLENNLQPYNTLMSKKTTFNVNGVSYTPSNYSSYVNDEITMTFALATSDNIYAVKTLLYLGINNFNSFLDNFEFNQESPHSPSLALGTNYMSLEELTLIYNGFASGDYSDPIFINRIYENDRLTFNSIKNIIVDLNDDFCIILSEMMKEMFSDLPTPINVTGKNINHLLTHKYAAKSGTTKYDAWMIGYSPYVTVGVWNGYPDNLEIGTINTKQLFAKIIEYYHRDIDSYEWFNNDLNTVDGNFVYGLNGDNNYKFIVK